MFLSRPDYDALRTEVAEQRTLAQGRAEQIATLKTQQAFLVAQIQQLARERVILLRQLTKLEIPMPELGQVERPAVSADDLQRALSSSLFEDMGDADAKRAGLTWTEDGRVVDVVTQQPVHA